MEDKVADGTGSRRFLVGEGSGGRRPPFGSEPGGRPLRGGGVLLARLPRRQPSTPRPSSPPPPGWRWETRSAQRMVRAPEPQPMSSRVPRPSQGRWSVKYWADLSHETAPVEVEQNAAAKHVQPEYHGGGQQSPHKERKCRGAIQNNQQDVRPPEAHRLWRPAFFHEGQGDPVPIVCFLLHPCVFLLKITVVMFCYVKSPETFAPGFSLCCFFVRKRSETENRRRRKFRSGGSAAAHVP